MKKNFLIFLPLLICLTGCSSVSEKNEADATSKTAKKVSAPAQEASAFIENLNNIDETINDGIARTRYTCTFDGIARSFILCRQDQSEAEALVLMLHGYAGSGESFMNDITFDESAVKKGYAVIFADGISDPDDKASAPGWNSGIKDSSKDDLAFLKSLVKIYQTGFGISNEKTFAAGFSNGAFMIHRLEVEASEHFAALASIAGFLPESVWNRRPEKLSAAFLQINGTKDDVVPMNQAGTAKYNKNPAIEDVLEYYRKANGSDSSVKYISIEGGRHSWPEERFCGFNIDKMLLDFFDSHK